MVLILDLISIFSRNELARPIMGTKFLVGEQSEPLLIHDN